VQCTFKSGVESIWKEFSINEKPDDEEVGRSEDGRDQASVVVGFLPGDALAVMIVQFIVPEPLIGVDGGAVMEPENQMGYAVVQSERQGHSNQQNDDVFQ
jgi:hypothetical protein